MSKRPMPPEQFMTVMWPMLREEMKEKMRITITNVITWADHMDACPSDHSDDAKGKAKEDKTAWVDGLKKLGKLDLLADVEKRAAQFVSLGTEAVHIMRNVGLDLAQFARDESKKGKAQAEAALGHPVMAKEFEDRFKNDKPAWKARAQKYWDMMVTLMTSCVDKKVENEMLKYAAVTIAWYDHLEGCSRKHPEVAKNAAKELINALKRADKLELLDTIKAKAADMTALGEDILHQNLKAMRTRMDKVNAEVQSGHMTYKEAIGRMFYPEE